VAKPDYSDRETLQAWLETQPREVGVVIAARAALRKLPLAGAELNSREFEKAIIRARLILPVFRSVAVSWVAAVFPANDTEKILAAAGTARNATMAVTAIAAAPTYVADATEAVAAAQTAAATATEAVAAARVAAQAVAPYTVAPNIIAPTIDATALVPDIKFIRNGIGGVSDLAFQPIWNNRILDRIAKNWEDLRSRLSGHEDWEVWIRWYEARLKGGPTYPHLSAEANKAIEMARVLEITEEDWKAGPAVVNVKIKAIEARFETPDPGMESSEIQIPPQMPAAIEPVWIDDRLTVDAGSATGLLPVAAIEAALKALGDEFRSLLGVLPSEANIDPRAIKYLTEVADGLPEKVPPQDQLFAVAHRGDALAIYGSTVNQEWPALLAARYQALVLHYDRVMRQFPQWVEFKRNAAVGKIPTEELGRAIELSQALRDMLVQGMEDGFVDPVLPEAFEKLENTHQKNEENPLPDADANSGNLISLDILESSNNTIKRLAEKALETAQSVGNYAAGHLKGGADEETEKQLRGLGKAGVKLVSYFIYGAGGSIAGVPFASWLLLNYPQTFSWLRPVLEALKAFI